MITRPEPSIIEPDAVVDVDTTPKPSTAAPSQQAQLLLLQTGKKRLLWSGYPEIYMVWPCGEFCISTMNHTHPLVIHTHRINL